MAGFVVFGVLRVLLNYRAEGLLFAAATRVVSDAHAGIVGREAMAVFGMATGRLAALGGKKLDLILPYITRYAPARVAVLPLVILALAFWQAWAVSVVFLVTGPMIPVFMDLVGMATKEASQLAARYGKRVLTHDATFARCPHSR